jgi:hypothetical protein
LTAHTAKRQIAPVGYSGGGDLFVLSLVPLAIVGALQAILGVLIAREFSEYPGLKIKLVL